MDCSIFTITHKKKAFSLFLSLSFLFLVSLYFINSNKHDPFSSFSHSHQESTTSSGECNEVRRLTDHQSRCVYVRSQGGCRGDGYVNYLEIFYCTCKDSSFIGYVILLLWLVVLFYLLGNTTAEYFCNSVEGLSQVLKLSPTIAGTTLLPLGNGANDVFASIISFTRSHDGDVGLNSVLGGAFFISCFVVGIVSIAISKRGVKVDESSFIRDVVFLLFTLCCLLVIVIFGKVNVWFAVCFVLIYVLYIAVVSVMQLFCTKKERVVDTSVVDEFGAMGIPLLGYVDEEKGSASEKVGLQILDQKRNWNLFVYILELPLYLPRRLTIPVISEEKWSKPFAVASSTLAPILMAVFWNTRGGNDDPKTSLAIYIAAIFVGILFGSLALVFTHKSTPPNRFRLPWLTGGFLMSIVWTYVLVQELVSLLVAFGNILAISPSILGLTVLAWGNSVGDLISNMSMALKRGPDGAQVAMSGCYAGPLFNVIVGLGLSLVFAAWEEYPSGYVIPKKSDLYETVGFLMMGLLWALVILPKNNMVLDKSLGVGLLSIYFCFLFLRLVKSVGLVKLGGSFCSNLKEMGILPRF